MYPIEIKDVSKFFGETKVLREINLKLNEETILGLIGHFGVGIKITLEMESTDAGKALIFGIKIIKTYRIILLHQMHYILT